MNIDPEGVLKDAASLRGTIRDLWNKVRRRELKVEEAAVVLDLLADFEIGHAFREEIMTILDKASTAVGASPVVTDAEDGEFSIPIPKKQVLGPDIKNDKIIQLRSRETGNDADAYIQK